MFTIVYDLLSLLLSSYSLSVPLHHRPEVRQEVDARVAVDDGSGAPGQRGVQEGAQEDVGLPLRGAKGVPRKGVRTSVNIRVWTCKEMRAKHGQTSFYSGPPCLGTPLVPSGVALPLLL